MPQSNSPILSPSSGAAAVEMQIASKLAAQAVVLPKKPTKYMIELMPKTENQRGSGRASKPS